MQKWKDGTVQMSFIRLLPNFHFYLNYPEPDACSFQTGLYLLKQNAAGISYHANSLKEDCFISAAKGQEFVFEANNNALEWIKDIVQ